MSFLSFGTKPTGARLEKIRQSPNFKDGAFRNIHPTEVTLPGVSFTRMLKDYLKSPKSVRPAETIPMYMSDLKHLEAETPAVVWLGHSSYFIKSRDFTILVDPVLFGNASPVSLFGKPFKGTNTYKPEEFPEIDLLLLTHDHYDHLNYETITQLGTKIKQVVAPLGVGAHLEEWGLRPSIITELDWWEEYDVTPGIRVTATPARHFSGRGLKRGNTLWASYVLQLHGNKLFLGGDSGYDDQFAKIGARQGPFDLAILECGQYGANWPFIHMMPEQSVQAAKDLGANMLLPVHWGKFVLSNHSWKEPIQRLIKAAAVADIRVTAPGMGIPYRIGAEPYTHKWWETIA